MKKWQHLLFILAALFVTLGIPCLLYTDLSGLTAGGSGTDGVTGASLELPEQPSGEFIVLMNRQRHPDTLKEWSAFFTGDPVGVIMEDISCMVPEGDGPGLQMAERYRARLAENQMSLRKENPVLVASRTECGLFDVVVLSREMADACRFSTVFGNEDVQVVEVKGEPS